ncbi:hypothetical protein GUITHDRAFT_155133 [Guillardia theta CCMP2712]|uniref:Uncharacterized protein n=1 Tax=Guillardia theta (strain CCMP2712) TaxID=905079 RepID=L1IM32_GUITC|nr:hypothetical protein GUITHDRAFT_155133 [Guillardia theta CCMP2712]EKX36850.1 hypothetical protein GUITHDRAFT_155133 [Guillardia theta CCMP2712]|mmetsp:Transcript_28773/g.92855  ORF Transcript_28773/g.92855 Transcript_28773/m.92855 type:complete len:331 (-) Transcript_28773:70-1062(-)|eukprot:XP_005823830.1 hypothetical protein GUITHDRAFT_155133 [Guillardia theta CCMP2712]
MLKDRRLNAAMSAVAACCLLAVVVQLSSTPRRQELETERLWGGLWSSLDDNVPNNNHVVDIGGDVVREAGTIRPKGGSPEFLADVIHHPRHAGGVYWGQPNLNGQRRMRIKKITKIVKQPTNGLIYHLQHQRSQPMPAWYHRNQPLRAHPLIARPRSLHKYASSTASHLPFHPLVVKPTHKTVAPSPHVPLAHPLKQLVHPAAPIKRPAAPSHVSAPVVDLPKKENKSSLSMAMIAKAYLRAQKLADEQKKHAEQEANQKKQSTEKKEELEAKALDQTASSLKNLAKVMDEKNFKSDPKKLAAIAKRLAVVSESLSGSAQDEVRTLKNMS